VCFLPLKSQLFQFQNLRDNNCDEKSGEGRDIYDRYDRRQDLGLQDEEGYADILSALLSGCSDAYSELRQKPDREDIKRRRERA
jgi:hypothetical protein